ncbi:MAG: hypothetical protein WCK63_11560 [Betaproteobacteria bacterium]
MNDSFSGSERIAATAFSQASMRAILVWLGSPPPPNAADQLMPLHCHLAALRASQISSEQRDAVMDSLFVRAISVISTLIPTLSVAALPIPRKTRQLVRGLQDLLLAIAGDLLFTLTPQGETGPSTPPPQAPNALALWRSLHALSLHLLISDLAASPPGVGIWRQLHRTFAIARQAGFARSTPRKAHNSLEDVYYAAVLLGCAQPASFTSQEVIFVSAYLELFADQIDAIEDTDPTAPASFWIDPERDAPATACARKPPPPDTPVQYFSCTQLAKLLEKQHAALHSGSTPKKLGLPDFSGTPAGMGVLNRLINHWGGPAKRRFSRRRQSHRATLVSGLEPLWSIFQANDEAAAESSAWMVTNESPDGYAIMHVAGKTGHIFVGNIAAIRIEPGNSWQVCIVRWALSENLEHLELGLQILATEAIPASIALPDHDNPAIRLPALILPEAPPHRSSEMLVVPSGVLDNYQGSIVLIIEKENLEIREVHNLSLDEQNSLIDVFSIESQRNAA